MKVRDNEILVRSRGVQSFEGVMGHYREHGRAPDDHWLVTVTISKRVESRDAMESTDDHSEASDSEKGPWKFGCPFRPVFLAKSGNISEEITSGTRPSISIILISV